MKATISTTLFTLALGLASAGPACAQDFQDMVAVEGNCRFQLVQGFFPCDPKVAYIVLKNGRQIVMFMKDDAMFSLSGENDRQPNLENYYLQIDTFRIMRNGRTTGEDKGMEGECHMSVSKDGSQFRSIKCDIYNRAKGTMYNFYVERIRSTKRTRG